MKQIGFKNYKRFEDFKPLELAPITLLVGPNNSGKSTFLKGVLLGYENTTNLNKSSVHSDFCNPVFSFDLTDFKAGISNFSRSHNYNSLRDEIDFNVSFPLVTVSRSETTHVDPTGIGFTVDLCVVPDSFYGKNESALSRISRITITDRGRLYSYIFDFEKQTMALEIKAEDYGTVTKPVKYDFDKHDILRDSIKLTEIKKNNIEVSENTEIPVVASVELPLKDVIWYYERPDALLMPKLALYIENFGVVLRALKEYRDNKRPVKTYPEMAYAPYIEKIVDSPMWSSLSQLFDFEPEIADYVEDSARDINASISLEKIDNNLIYIPVYTPSRLVLYRVTDENDYIAHTIQEYRKSIKGKKQEDVKREFINTWLDKFDIGAKFLIDTKEGEYYSFKVQPKGSDRYINLADLGTGSIHLIILLLNIATLINDVHDDDKSDHDRSKYTLVVEEPEQNLHPEIQSKLVDLILDASEYMHFIVETHSEYFIRKTQVLIAEKEYRDESELMRNPFKVYYFPEDGEPYDMEYTTTGRLKRKFGKGFFNVSAELVYKLF